MFKKTLILVSLSFSIMGNTYFDKVKSYFIATQEQQKQKDLNQIKKHLSNIDYYLKNINEFEKFSISQTQMIAIVKNNPNNSLIKFEIDNQLQSVSMAVLPVLGILGTRLIYDSYLNIKNLNKKLANPVFVDLRHMSFPEIDQIKSQKYKEYENIFKSLKVLMGGLLTNSLAIYKLRNSKFYSINYLVQGLIKNLESIKAILSKYPENTFDYIIDYNSLRNFIGLKDMSLNLSQYKLNMSKYNYNIISTNSSNVKDYLNFKSIKQELYSIIDRITLGKSKQVFVNENK